MITKNESPQPENMAFIAFILIIIALFMMLIVHI